MKEAQPDELAGILTGDMDYALELGILQEPRLCRGPVHKFERAFVAGGKNFCLIYSEAGDIAASYNSRVFEQILREYSPRKIIFHSAAGNCESYYCRGEPCPPAGSGIRLLTPGDKKIAQGSVSPDDYLSVIFSDFIERQIWRDCGIIGAFDGARPAGYLAYYELAENIRDISYIYVREDFRGSGCARKLLAWFKNKNSSEGKISYYSYAADQASANLAKSCGFLPCAKREEHFL